MGFAKLREWLWTVTGKGDRWGRDRLGRSAPAFLSTIALPPPTCTVRQGRPTFVAAAFRCETGHLLAVCLRPVPGGESAGCVCLQCLVQQAVCLFTLCLPCPLPSSVLAPVQLFCFAPFSVQVLLCLPCSFPCAPGSNVHKNNMFARCKTVPLAAATWACSGGPCAGSI